MMTTPMFEQPKMDVSTTIQNCSNCMHHIAHRNGPIRSPGGPCYWMCEITRKGKKPTSGRTCKDFESRYVPKDRGNEWRVKAVPEPKSRTSKTSSSSRYTRSKFKDNKEA